MDNQHKQITGYRDLSQAEITAMNVIKEKGEELRALIDELTCMDSVDKRWVYLAESQLQQGIMALVRAVAQPTTF